MVQTKQQREVANFTGLQMNGIGEVIIIQDGTESLTIEADQEYLDKIITEVRNGQLVIDMKKDFHTYFDRITGHNMIFTLHIKNFYTLVQQGVASVVIEKLDTEDFALTNKGVGDIKVNNVTANKVTVGLEGTGTISINGTAHFVDVSSKGLGTYNGADLKAKEVVATLQGAGKLEVFASEQVTAKLNGVGNITYHGNPPKVEVSQNGIGSISKA